MFRWHLTCEYLEIWTLQLLTTDRFTANEKWRTEFGVDDLIRNFDYKEKPEMFKYYPQYYHKTDKVSFLTTRIDVANIG